MEVIGVRFKKDKKISYFRIDSKVAVGDNVCVKDGETFVCVPVVSKKLKISQSDTHLPKVELAETRQEQKDKICEDVFACCEEMIQNKELQMQLISVERDLQINKYIICFKSERRVDFRQLARDLAVRFRAKVEFRQVNEREQARRIGGLGICGREFCCRKFLFNFEPISVKRVRRNMPYMSVNKMSGACGRLMCCFKFEWFDVLEEKVNLQEELEKGKELEEKHETEGKVEPQYDKLREERGSEKLIVNVNPKIHKKPDDLAVFKKKTNNSFPNIMQKKQKTTRNTNIINKTRAKNDVSAAGAISKKITQKVKNRTSYNTNGKSVG